MEKTKERKNWLEWVVTGISSVIVAFTIGILIYQMAVAEETPPDIVISLGKSEAKNDYYTIPVTVKNNGATTAQKLRIEFAMGEGADIEKSLLEFDYLPGNSSVKGWISFSENPQGKYIKPHILGYTSP